MQEKTIETKQCNCCNITFHITDKDIEFYDKTSPIFNEKKHKIPTPTLCPNCRYQRRLTWINERNLYNGKCNLCNNKIISRFNPKSWITVYCYECWASDKWEMSNFWKDINLKLTIFDQIHKLIKTTPFQNMIWSLSNIKNNARYTNYTADIKDSYLVFESDFVENCYYGRWIRKSNDIVDCTVCVNSEHCYECVNGDNLYKVYFSNNCTWCNNSYFLKNCHWCNYCIWCTNLSNQEYHILNKKSSKEEYEKLVNSFKDKKKLDKFIWKFNEIVKNDTFPTKKIVNSEDCSWNYIFNSKKLYWMLWYNRMSWLKILSGC